MPAVGGDITPLKDAKVQGGCPCPDLATGVFAPIAQNLGLDPKQIGLSRWRGGAATAAMPAEAPIRARLRSGRRYQQ